MNYITNFFKEEKKEYSWISCIIMFSDEGKVFLDKVFIVKGDIEKYPFYCQFKNFSIINNELYYLFPTCMKKINPEKVYLHLRTGISPHPIEKENITFWHLFFTSPTNKIYRSIELKKENIKIFEFEEKKSKKEIYENPLFLKKQVYDENSVLFSNLKIFDI